MTTLLAVLTLVLLLALLTRLAVVVRNDGLGLRTPPASHTAPDRTGHWW
ncbi:hypothetical protein GCM10025865_26040 [Paraoerskovia sediminicola]|uniref:Uncharacterized protein n=1 Tax=Paraoerskovia sediminicola TaxID=1138587 RepID=A0ABM8G5F5_9CELL|nr:hypothetical protein [Paraoerskovia sediminicola]BDZ43305.1 hypothetical protein GCM10025865_26040 [Paraoerskovia sediminicola]